MSFRRPFRRCEKKGQMPPEWRTFKQAQRADEPGASQMEMEL